MSFRIDYLNFISHVKFLKWFPTFNHFYTLINKGNLMKWLKCCVTINNNKDEDSIPKNNT